MLKGKTKKSFTRPFKRLKCYIFVFRVESVKFLASMVGGKRIHSTCDFLEEKVLLDYFQASLANKGFSHFVNVDNYAVYGAHVSLFI